MLEQEFYAKLLKVKFRVGTMRKPSSVPATRRKDKTVAEERAQSFLRDHQAGVEPPSPEELKAILKCNFYILG